MPEKRETWTALCVCVGGVCRTWLGRRGAQGDRGVIEDECFTLSTECSQASLRGPCLAESRRFDLEPLCPGLPVILHPDKIIADSSRYACWRNCPWVSSETVEQDERRGGAHTNTLHLERLSCRDGPLSDSRISTRRAKNPI